MHTDTAVLLAAGLGSRLGAPEGHKILARIGGRTLLDRHLENFARLGVRDLVLVAGHRADELASAVEALPRGPVRLRVVTNPDYMLSNGTSVLAAVDQADLRKTPFWLSMGDHLFEPALFDDIARGERAPHAGARGALWVDQKIGEVYDLPDATKLRLGEGGRVEAIGKGIEPFDRIDVGLFWCAPDFCEALREEREERDDCSTSDALRRLDARGVFELIDVGPRRWQDVDTPGAREHAAHLIALFE